MRSQLRLWFPHLRDHVVPIFICARYPCLVPPVQDKPHTQLPKKK
jgi:hypothetical protein